MLRVLALIVALVVIVFVAASVVKTFFWLALIALIVAALCLGFGFVRLGKQSTRRSRDKF